MSFFVSKSCCPRYNQNGSIKKYVSDILFNVDTKQYNSLLQLKFYVGIHCKFNLPINSILLDVESNIFSIQDINLNIDFSDVHYTWLSGSININLNESNIFSQPLNDLNVYFIGNFKINDEAFNRANIDMSQESYSSFVNELYTYNNKIIDDKTSITNVFDLSTLNITNIQDKYINDYNKYVELPKDFYISNNSNNPFTPQLLVSNYIDNKNIYYFKRLFDIINHKNASLEFNNLSINLDYSIDNKIYKFQLKNINNKQTKTNFNYFSNEIIEDSENGLKGIYIPKKAKIKFLLWFKYKFSYYYINYEINNDIDLFGSQRNSLFSWEVY